MASADQLDADVVRRLGRIAFAPVNEAIDRTPDNRRFGFYAKTRGLDFQIARHGGDYDTVVLGESADLPYWTRRRGPRVIFDMPNPQLLDTRLSVEMGRGTSKYLRRQWTVFQPSWRRAVTGIIERADAVVVCSPEIRDTLLGLNANIHVILDAHFDLPLVPRSTPDPAAPPTIVWEGKVRSLGAFDVLADQLRTVSAATGARYVFVTDRSEPRLLGRFGSIDTEAELRRHVPGARVIAWTPQALARELSTASVGIIPVDVRSSIHRAKPENRLLLMWRAGLPTVTSGTPAYVRTMRAAGLHDYCPTPQDWAGTLMTILNDPDRLRRNAELGGALVHRDHGLEQWLAAWDTVLTSVVARPAP